MSKKQRIRVLEARVEELEREVERLRAWIETMQAKQAPTPYPTAGQTITGDNPPEFACWDGAGGTTCELPPGTLVTLTSTDGLGRSD